MLVMLIRHAQADQQSETQYPDDSVRPLVPKGRKVQRRVTRAMRKRGLVPSRVFSSPWKRAWQTARIVVEELGLSKNQRIPCQGLAGPPDLQALAAEIGEVAPDETIGLVGHEPWMSELAQLLLTGEHGRPHLDFPKSGVMGIELDGWNAGTGVLRFFLVP